MTYNAWWGLLRGRPSAGHKTLSFIYPTDCMCQMRYIASHGEDILIPPIESRSFRIRAEPAGSARYEVGIAGLVDDA